MSTITAILEPCADGTLHLPVPWTRGKFRVNAVVELIDEALIQEHAVVRLRHDVAADGLKAGDTGTVVHVYEGGSGYEVEFIHGRTRPKLVTVEPADIELAEAGG